MKMKGTQHNKIDQLEAQHD